MSDRIDEIKRLLAEASPGPWSVGEYDCDIYRADGYAITKNDDAKEADLRLIAAAPELLAWCVGEIERLREDRELACESPNPGCDCPGCSLARALAEEPKP